MQSVVSASVVSTTEPDVVLTIASARPDAPQRKTALAVVVVLLVIEALAALLGRSSALRIDAFVLFLQTALCVVDSLIAVLLFSQYSIQPRWDTLAIASGFAFGALFAFMQALSVPSLVAVIGVGSNTGAWLFIDWHTIFPLTVIIYGLSRQEESTIDTGRAKLPSISVINAIAWVVVAMAGLTWLASASSQYLPDLSAHPSQASSYATVGLWLISSVALVLLLVRRQTLLDLWLIVMLLAWWPNFLADVVFTFDPFSAGWCLARCPELVAGSALLFVLFSEITILYARLASAILFLRRARTDRFAIMEAATMGVAHEMKQPLAGIALSAAAGRKWLQKTPPIVDKAAMCFASIISASHRAEEVTLSVRGSLKRAPKQMLQLNELCRDVLRRLQYDVIASEISVTVDYPKDIPEVLADAAQLQQAVFNLIENGIEAMNDRPSGDRRLRVATRREGKSAVTLCVEDTGPGISDQIQARLFEPFVTTKSANLGLGLMICRTIVEDHSGTLRLCRSDLHGSVFEMTLPINPSGSRYSSSSSYHSSSSSSRP